MVVLQGERPEGRDRRTDAFCAVVGSWNVDWLPYTNASCRSAGLRDVHQTQPEDDASAAPPRAGRVCVCM